MTNIVNSNTSVKKILKDFPNSKPFFNQIGINKVEQALTINELCKRNKIPLITFLKKFEQKFDAKIVWPKVKIDPAAEKAKLRTGKPESVQNVIFVHSGKGGVGKTSVSIGLSLAMAKNYKVGLLDLDIDCPNIYKRLNITHRHVVTKDQKIEPYNYNALKLVSMAGIVNNAESPVLWRGPIVAKAVEQLLHDVNWGNLDYLVIDLPPGTSDVPLTLLQILIPQIVVFVTSPQQSAILDTNKSLNMFKKFNLKKYFLIQNMYGEIFGEVNREKFDLNIPLKREFVDGFKSKEYLDLFTKIISQFK